MTTQEFISLASSAISPILWGVVAFYIKNLIGRFDTLEKEVKQMLIKGASTDERINAIEKRLNELEDKIWEFLKSK